MTTPPLAALFVAEDHAGLCEGTGPDGDVPLRSGLGRSLHAEPSQAGRREGDGRPMTVTNLTKRRRADREALLGALPGFPAEQTTGLESWDVDLGDFGASVIVAREDIAGPNAIPDWRWHVSVSGADRLPEWAEFAQIVHSIRPGVVFCMPLPPRSWWINIAENCLHAWEISDEALVDQWRGERQGHDPS